MEALQTWLAVVSADVAAEGVVATADGGAAVASTSAGVDAAGRRRERAPAASARHAARGQELSGHGHAVGHRRDSRRAAGSRRHGRRLHLPRLRAAAAGRRRRQAQAG